MPVIDLLRHGETTMHGHLNGRTDPPLSDTGWEQVRRQAEGRTWRTVISSPARRANEPALEIAARSGVKLATDPRWWEMDFGDWDGQTFEMLRSNPHTHAALRAHADAPEDVTPPNGESWHAFADRIRDGLTTLEDDTLVVCHAGVIRAALHVTCDLPPKTLWRLRIGYAARVRLAFGTNDDGQFWGEIVELVQS